MGQTGTRGFAKSKPKKPARGRQPGNQNATKHGLYTPDKDALKLRAQAVRNGASDG